MWKKFISHPIVRGIIYFFPFQLLMLHLQRNQILLIIWLIVFGFVSNRLGVGLGMSYLFIVPEYMGNVSPYSYALVGFAFGGFITAFNVSSYVINSHRFTFLAALQRPFSKYCLNNFIIPTTVIIVYLFNIYHHLKVYELMPPVKIYWNLLAFLGGTFCFILISGLYFQFLNKDFKNLFGSSADDDEGKSVSIHLVKSFKLGILKRHFIGQVTRRSRYRDEWPVAAYFCNPFKILRTKQTEHLDRAKLLMVFQQNHITASVFAVIVFLSLILLGAFRENKIFELPAAASMMLFGTMGMMVVAAVHFFMRNWSTIFFIAGILLLNFISKHSDFRAINYAYGLDYTHLAIYDPEAMSKEIIESGSLEKDITYHEGILDNWKKKAYVNLQISSKPKMVIINCSGGGLKSALWTFYSLQVTDQLLEGKLLQNTVLITGSSGGMIGASYLRELYLQQQLGVIDNFYDPTWGDNIAKDMLNPIASAIALNDMFLRWQHFTEGNYRYPKDRGYAFERKLNENTNYVLDKRLGDYTEVERQAIIPMMFFSPAITNDAKRLIISSQPVSFMSYNSIDNSRPAYIENIEFTRLFKDQNPYNLKFTSAIRMNATFPYVLPVVSLPSSPYLEIMDAGMRDNYGTRTAMQYLFQMREWINANTSGVVVIRISDGRKVDYEKQRATSLLQDLLSPLGGLVGNVTKIHLQENNQLIQMVDEALNVPMDIVEYRLGDIKDAKKISMSFHLTPREKKKIKEAFEDKVIQDEILHLNQNFFKVK
jgi:hypothetical protein